MFNIYKRFCTSKYLNTWQGSWWLDSSVSVFRSSGHASERRERHIKAKARILESHWCLLLRQHSTTLLPGTLSLGIWCVFSKDMLDEEQFSYCCEQLHCYLTEQLKAGFHNKVWVCALIFHQNQSFYFWLPKSSIKQVVTYYEPTGVINGGRGKAQELCHALPCVNALF